MSDEEEFKRISTMSMSELLEYVVNHGEYLIDGFYRELGRALFSRAELVGWKAMDSAPLDGRRVLLEVDASSNRPPWARRKNPSKTLDWEGRRIVEAWFTKSHMDSAPRWQVWCGCERVASTDTLKPIRWMEKP